MTLIQAAWCLRYSTACCLSGCSNANAQGISLESLRYFSKHIPAKHLLFVIDACASTSANAVFQIRASPNDFNPDTNDMHALLQHMKEEAVQVLTAGCIGQDLLLDGKDKPTSIFLRVLLDALQGEVFLNDCDWISTQQLASWLQVAVAKETKNVQFPQYDKQHR